MKPNDLSEKQLEEIERKLREFAKDARDKSFPSFSSKFSKRTYSRRQLEALCHFHWYTVGVGDVFNRAKAKLRATRADPTVAQLALDVISSPIGSLTPISYRKMVQLLRVYPRLRRAIGLKRIPNAATLHRYDCRRNQEEAE